MVIISLIIFVVTEERKSKVNIFLQYFVGYRGRQVTAEQGNLF